MNDLIEVLFKKLQRMMLTVSHVPNPNPKKMQHHPKIKVEDPSSLIDVPDEQPKMKKNTSSNVQN